jgi:ATP-dependent Clp endopeptidase proteolytic subunit ClpP
MKKWYEIKNKAEKAEIWIYEQIGEDFWSGGGTTAKGFQEELSKVKASQIDLHINSPGGEVFDGITIYNLLKQHPANITTYIDGIAASIASVIALAGDRVIMAENALYMVHNPSGIVMGNANDMRSMADVLDKVAGSMIVTYTGKSKKTEDEIKAYLDAETWMNADEALEAGFVDEISEKMEMAACAKFAPVMAKAGFKHVPDIVSVKKEKHSARDLERILRDGGCSEAMAKSILAEGFKGDQRDVAPEADQRDVAAPAPAVRDRNAELLIKAEVAAPTITQ